MKKNLIILSLLSLTLISCGNGKDSSILETKPSDSGNKEPESTLTTSQPEQLEFEPAKSISSLFDYINTTARETENTSGIIFDRKYYSYEVGYYTFNVVEKEETGESFSNDTFFKSGKETKTVTYDYKEDKDVSEDTYMTLSQIEGNDYYDIVDFGNGKERDKASKEDVVVTNRDSYQAKTYLNAADSLYSFYKSNISKNIIKGLDDITPVINDKSVDYHIPQVWEEQIGNYKYKYTAVIDLSLDKKGRLTNYKYDFQENQPEVDENNVQTGKLYLLSEIKDEVTITFGSKIEYDYLARIDQNEQAIDPLDYFMTDYKVVLQSWDGVGTERTSENALTFPVGMYVEAVAEEVVPEKSLDTKLTITDSTNKNVISVSSTGVVKSVGVGETTLTIESETGIGKTVDVKVVSPKLTSIKAETYSTYHYKGDTETLYIYKNPDNSLDEIEVVSLTPEIVEIVKDKDGDAALHNIGLGEAKVEVRSKKDPSVKCTLTYTVQEKMTAEQVKKNVVGTWKGDVPNTDSTAMVKDAFTVVYNEDMTGSLTLTKEGTGYTFEINKAYPFTYTFMDEGRYSDRPVSLMMSTIVLDHGSIVWTYSANAADFYYTGENANIIFSTGNSEEFGAMVQLSARRVA